MKKETKRDLVRGLTAVAFLLLAVACLKQCKDKNAYRDLCEKQVVDFDEVSKIVQREMDKTAEKTIELKDARDSLKSANDEIDGLKDTLVVRDSLVAGLRDSLNTVNKDLTDCRNGKKVIKKSKKACPTCPTKKPVVKAPVKPCAPKAVNVAKPCTPVASQNANAATTNVAFGCGSHDNTVNINNGTVNNYYGEAADTAKKVSKLQYVSCYTNKVVRCR